MAAFEHLRRYVTLGRRSDARLASDVRDELQLHIDLRAADFEREGLAPADALARARREFGDVDEASRYCVAVDRQAQRRWLRAAWMADVRQDVGHALRLLGRSPAYALATVVTLALGFAGSTVAYGVLRSYLVRPLPYPDADRLLVVQNAPHPRFRPVPDLTTVDWSRLRPLFDGVVTTDIDGFTIVGEPHAETVTGAWVSPDYFTVFGATPAMGRPFSDDEYRERAPVAIISHALWQRRFAGDSAVIGATLAVHAVDGASSLLTVIGVLPNDFWPLRWDNDVLRPLSDVNQAPWVVRLKPGATRASAERELDAAVKAQLTGSIHPQWRMTTTPVLEWYAGTTRQLLMAILGASMFMLVATCASVGGALVSRTVARRAELAIRLSIGGGATRIARQLLTESLVTSMLAGLVAALITYPVLRAAGPLTTALLNTPVPGGNDALGLDASTLIPLSAASVAAGLLLGMLPIAMFLRFRRTASGMGVLAGRTSSLSGGAGVRRVLIGLQVGVATVLLFGAGLMFRTIERMNDLTLGFESEGLVKAGALLPSTHLDSVSRAALMARLLERVSGTPEVQLAAAVYPYPFGGGFQFPVLTEGGSADEESAPRSTVHVISPDYFRVMGIPLRSGRAFATTEDAASPLSVIVSEQLARQIAPAGDAVGRRIRVRVPYLANFTDDDDRPWRTIVGVASDVREAFAEQDGPNVYVPYAQSPRAQIGFVFRTTGPEGTAIPAIRKALNSVEPALALTNVGTMSDLIRSSGGPSRGMLTLLGYFATVAVILSAVALYASLSYAIVQRRSELAVRLAVGATTRSIMTLMLREGLVTAGIGLGAGIMASLAFGRVLEAQVYGIATNDVTTLITITTVLAAAAGAACAIPAWRAARTDPAFVLRTS